MPNQVVPSSVSWNLLSAEVGTYKLKRCSGILLQRLDRQDHIGIHINTLRHIVYNFVTPVVVHQCTLECIINAHLSALQSKSHLSRGSKCAGCLCTSLGWFKRIEPPRTFSNHIIAEIARCVEFFHMSSGWFDCTLHTLLPL